MSCGVTCRFSSPAILLYDLYAEPYECLTLSLAHSSICTYWSLLTLCRMCVIMYLPEYLVSGCPPVFCLFSTDCTSNSMTSPDCSHDCPLTVSLSFVPERTEFARAMRSPSILPSCTTSIP